MLLLLSLCFVVVVGFFFNCRSGFYFLCFTQVRNLKKKVSTLLILRMTAITPEPTCFQSAVIFYFQAISVYIMESKVPVKMEINEALANIFDSRMGGMDDFGMGMGGAFGGGMRGGRAGFGRGGIGNLRGGIGGGMGGSFGGMGDGGMGDGLGSRGGGFGRSGMR